MPEGLSWEQIGILAAIAIPLCGALLGYLFKIDRGVVRIQMMLVANGKQHKWFRRQLSEHDGRLQNHECRLVRLEGQGDDEPQR